MHRYSAKQQRAQASDTAWLLLEGYLDTFGLAKVVSSYMFGHDEPERITLEPCIHTMSSR